MARWFAEAADTPPPTRAATPALAGSRGGQKNLTANEYRAAASHLLKRKADGIYLFNFFTSREEGPKACEPPFEVLRVLGQASLTPDERNQLRKP